MSNVWCVRVGFGTKGLLHGSDIAIGESGAERSAPHCRDVVPKTLIASELRMANADHFLREAV